MCRTQGRCRLRPSPRATARCEVLAHWARTDQEHPQPCRVQQVRSPATPPSRLCVRRGSDPNGHEKSIREAMGEVLAEREREKEVCKAANSRDASSVRKDLPRSKKNPGLETPKSFSIELERGNPAVAERILELLADGPMMPSALREAVGIRSSIHFNRYYLSPLLGKGIIARTDPDHPQSPQQRYCLS